MKRITLTIFTVLTVASIIFSQDIKQDVMFAHFIDVGQGEATLLEFPCGAILIDAGAQDKDHEIKLINYLDNFFKKRDDLNRTIDLIIVTHAHLDHNMALDAVVLNFNVKSYIDNGVRNGSGRKNQKWLQDNSAVLDIQYMTYSFEEIIEKGGVNGYTDNIIDPLICDVVDPKIYLLSGRFENKPSLWSNSAYKNGNNHSIVVKIVFDNATFLFTGDLEEHGIKTLVNHYSGSRALDSDVLQVGHHGSYNATSEEFLHSISPSHAIISCGKWNYGLGPNDNKRFNTYNFGHPRIVVLNQLQDVISGKRSKRITVKAAEKSMTFTDYDVTKKVYSTSWDNNIKVQASSDGSYRVTVNQ